MRTRPAAARFVLVGVFGLLVVLGVHGGCGGGQSGLGPGEACSSSSQCGDGLVCDFVASPPACSLVGGIPPDAPIEPTEDAALAVDGPDAAPSPDGTPDGPIVLPPDARLPDARLPDARLPDAPTPDAALDAL